MPPSRKTVAKTTTRAKPARRQRPSPNPRLNTELGAVRDLDVAVERVKSLNDKRPQALPAFQSWNEKRAEGHRHLARMLRSVRYGWLIEQASAWIENGPWSTKTGKQATRQRAAPIGAYSADKIAAWEQKLLKK